MTPKGISSSPTSCNPSVYLDAERTQLAWTRSGVALMGMGFVVARFGLVLQELDRVHSQSIPHHDRTSLLVGIALVFFGVAVHVNGVVQHARWYASCIAANCQHFESYRRPAC